MSSVVNSITTAMATIARHNPFATIPVTVAAGESLRDNPQALYVVLRALYENNDVYAAVNQRIANGELKGASIQGLRNPTAAACEFHEFTTWPGTLPDALPIEMPERIRSRRSRRRAVSLPGRATRAGHADRLESAILRGWAASNWDENKDVLALDLAVLGDQFFKVSTRPDNQFAYLQLLDPAYVTDFATDLRGFLTYIRIDVQTVERDAKGLPVAIIETEVWDKASGSYRLWRKERHLWSLSDVSQLGEPLLEAPMAQYGVDFLPFKQIKFRNEGIGQRGTAAVTPALDKVIYGDLLTTALHQRLSNHNKPDMVLKGTGTDKDGKPLPPPKIQANNAGFIEINGIPLFALPAGWDIAYTVANLNYADHLAAVQGHYDALRQTDLPQLTYYTVSEAGGDLSGKAISYKLRPAISLAEKVRGNAEVGLIRATQMLLTVNQHLKVPGYSVGDIGTYAAGDWEFWFEPRDTIPLTRQEEIEVMQAQANVAKVLIEAGATDRQAAFEVAGLDPDDAIRLAATVPELGTEPAVPEPGAVSAGDEAAA